MTLTMTNANLQNSMEQFTKVVPILLLAIAGLTFIGVGIFHTNFYSEVFSSRFGATGGLAFGIFLAVVHEVTRFALLVASVRDFTDNKRGNGWLGLVGSLALVAYDIKISNNIAALWAKTGFDATIYASTIVFLILLGLLLEIRLILTVSKA
jgi:hypothetical protein